MTRRTIRDLILDAWTRCKTEDEKSHVLVEIQSARHELEKG